MNIFTAIILGIIEGLTEFLPVSSTGHLIIAQKLLGLQQIDEFFTVVIQLGAILAAVFFFRERIKNILLALTSTSKSNIRNYEINRSLGIWILVSILPILGVGFIMRKQIESLQNSTLVVALATIVFGIVFYLIEKEVYTKNVNKLSIDKIKFKNVFTMGLYQMISLIPGVSRSGATIAGGMSQNLKIKDSIEISFIMGIPVIFVVSFYKLISVFSSLSLEVFIYTLIGTIVSFVVGLYGIKMTIGYLEKKGFYPFMVYRIILGSIILLLLFIGFIK